MGQHFVFEQIDLLGRRNQLRDIGENRKRGNVVLVRRQDRIRHGRSDRSRPLRELRKRSLPLERGAGRPNEKTQIFATRTNPNIGPRKNIKFEPSLHFSGQAS